MQTLKLNQKEIFWKCIKIFCHIYIYIYIYIYTHMIENYAKDLKESIYHGAVVSALAIGFTMIERSLI